MADSLTGVAYPERHHHIATDTASWTACGASVPHMNEACSTDPAQVTCPDCLDYLDQVKAIEDAAYDCSTEGHVYEMITTGDGDPIALNCSECGARWKVERTN